ncbi:MAG: hypothetical protein KF709_01610 [Gemmatimonadaceae bacterium]|nr:hypothetical protein [Gemmatimonadaceae bacterium]
MSIPKLALVVAVALSSTACIKGLETTNERTAYVTAVTHQAADSTYHLKLTGAFYRTEQAASAIDTPDVCGIYAYSVNPPGVAYLPTLNAGQFLFTNVAGRVDTLFRSSASGLTIYQLVSTLGIPFSSGDTLRLTVPGDVDGFPPVQASVRLAERFNFDPVGEPGDGEALPLSWQAAAVPGSFVFFSLRFNSTGISSEPNAQLFCVFQDDGAGSIDANLAIAWKSSVVESRSVFASRVRRSIVTIDERTRLVLFSYFDVPTPALADP